MRRHPNKGKKWVKDKYFLPIEGRKWVFSGKVMGKDGAIRPIQLFHERWIHQLNDIPKSKVQPIRTTRNGNRISSNDWT